MLNARLVDDINNKFYNRIGDISINLEKELEIKNKQIEFVFKNLEKANRFKRILYVALKMANQKVSKQNSQIQELMKLYDSSKKTIEHIKNMLNGNSSVPKIKDNEQESTITDSNIPLIFDNNNKWAIKDYVEPGQNMGNVEMRNMEIYLTSSLKNEIEIFEKKEMEVSRIF